MATSRLVTYTADEFMKANGLSESLLRKYRRQGLRILQTGQKRFIRGADWEAFLLSRSPQSTTPNTEEK